jgi:hypothetical protein
LAGGVQLRFIGEILKIAVNALEESDEQIGSLFILVAHPSDSFPSARRL